MNKRNLIIHEGSDGISILSILDDVFVSNSNIKNQSHQMKSPLVKTCKDKTQRAINVYGLGYLYVIIMFIISKKKNHNQ